MKAAMKNLIFVPMLLGFLGGSLAGGCLVENVSHCAYPDSTVMGVCPSGFRCAKCVSQNNGCIPEDDDLPHEGCVWVDPPGEGSTSTTTMETETGLPTGGMTSFSNTLDSTTFDPTTGNSSSSTTSDATTETVPMCGNGLVEGEEECDDGNLIETDACLSTCMAATCGDGFIQQDVETCEDGNEEPNDFCDQCQIVEHRKVFVTQEEFKGNLGGLPGADVKCQAAASGAMLEGTFIAWISDGNESIKDRMDVSFTGVYELMDGTFLARGWDDLVDFSLKHSINQDEFSQEMFGVVWTNTLEDGTSAGLLHCEAWMGTDPLKQGRIGTTALADSEWTNSYNQACSSPAHLYCFEDLAPMP